jgi:hypothetical protein
LLSDRELTKSSLFFGQVKTKPPSAALPATMKLSRAPRFLLSLQTDFALM